MPDPSLYEESGISRFEAALLRRAGRLDKDIKQLLADDRLALRQSNYPGPECLNPYEVAQFGEELPEDRLKHLETCPTCAALLDAARPSSEKLEDILKRLLEKARASIAVAPTASPKKPVWGTLGDAIMRIPAETSENPLWRPLIDVMRIEVCLIVGIIVLVISIGIVGDANLRNAVSAIAPSFLTKVVLFAVVIALLVLTATKWLKIGQGATFQRLGGLAGAGVFTALSGFWGANLLVTVSSNYANMEGFQNAFVRAVAESYRTGREAGLLANANAALAKMGASDGSLLSATSFKSDGKVVARGQPLGVDIQSDFAPHRSFTIYDGILAHNANGQVEVQVSAHGKSPDYGGNDKAQTKVNDPTTTDKIAIGSNLSVQGLGVGTPVLALVPSNSTQASVIFPVYQAPNGATAPSVSRVGGDNAQTKNPP
jgi:fumarate reductase subunit D